MFIGGFVIAAALERAVPLPLVSDTSLGVVERTLGWLVLALGASLYLSAIAALRRAQTAVLPGDTATQLVTSGPYRFSRNPAYLGLAITWCGVAALTNWGWLLVLLPAVVFGQQRFVIRAEERHLAERFGETYTAYRRRVRRWC
jgi:protein-S-isoprenylcysteine O-methyltransferase Ste14